MTKNIPAPCSGVSQRVTSPPAAKEDEDLPFDQCDWYDHLGGGPIGYDACKSDCPGSRIRSGMESRDCRTGSRAMCCTTKSKLLKGRSDEFLEKYDDTIDGVLADLTCPDSSNNFDVFSGDLSPFAHEIKTGTELPSLDYACDPFSLIPTVSIINFDPVSSSKASRQP